MRDGSPARPSAILPWGRAVPRYLVQLAYTPEAWAAQPRNPQNRVEVIRPALERVGGRVEAPDNAAAAGFVLAVAAGGAMKVSKTMPLLTVEEGLEAMRRSCEVAQLYRPPAG